MIQATIRLANPSVKGRRFVARTGSDHELVIDDAAGNTGPKPIELLAVAVGGCTAFDVISILRKKRQQVDGYEVRVEAEQVQDPPQVFTEIRILHKLIGAGLDRKAVADAIRLSEEKYCSVGAMIKTSAPIHSRFEIVTHTAQSIDVPKPDTKSTHSEESSPVTNVPPALMEDSGKAAVSR
jgi:putative redox protein